jgi:hypothetical protein
MEIERECPNRWRTDYIVDLHRYFSLKYLNKQYQKSKAYKAIQSKLTSTDVRCFSIAFHERTTPA